MPKFPGVLQNNNPNAPSVDLNDLQVKGAGIFADVAARDLLDANIQTEGYLAIMKDTDTIFIYTGGGWGTTSNWTEVSGTVSVTDADGSPIGDVTQISFPEGNITIAGSVGIVNFNGLATQTEVDQIETSLGTGATGAYTSPAAGSVLIADGTNFGVSTYVFPTSDGTTDQLLQTDGNGNVSFVTFQGSPWTADTNGITYTAGNVGVGIASSATKALSVSGGMNLDGSLTVFPVGETPATVAAGELSLQNGSNSIIINSYAGDYGGTTNRCYRQQYTRYYYWG